MFRLGRRAVSALEFAVVAPLLVLLMVAASDFGSALQQATRLETAARSGAQYALAFPSDAAGLTAATVEALPTVWQDGATNVLQQCTCDGFALGACTSNCAGELVITVTTRRAFAPVLFFALPTELAGNATVRIR